MCDFRADEVVKSKDIIAKFIEIGLSNVNIGIESMTQSQLNFYCKTTTVQQNILTLQILCDLGVNFTMGIMMFDPIVSVSDIHETLEVFRRIEIHKRQYNVNRPLSIGSSVVATMGTPLFDYVVEHGLYENNENNYRFLHDKTKLCYDIVNEWSKSVIPLFNKNYLYYAAKENDRSDLVQEIVLLYEKLFDLDLRFLLEVTNGILDGTISDAASCPAASHYDLELQSVKVHLQELEEHSKAYL